MKIVDHRSLPDDRLATIDEKGRRLAIFPASVQGAWRNKRTVVQVILIILFLIAPWISIGGHQMILMDIPRRQFAFFGLTFWAHDVPILFFVLILATLILAFVTAIWGRIWCGWACPQTVFIDGVFRRIERWVVGTHLEQVALARGPWTRQKVIKYSIKWGLFTAVTLVISHSFLAYFVGSDQLGIMITSDPRENWTSFLVMAGVSGFLLFDFGWFREQFCIIMCPYGRIQSLLMDNNSLAITYDEKRGEPRRQKGVENTGDCVDCYRCVSVCPTGIDIRRGVQLECIACTACVDACDDVMEKIKKPKGLIRYDSINGIMGRARRVFTPRLALYIFLLSLASGGLLWALSHRTALDVMVLRGHDEPFQLGSDGIVSNHFKLHIKNQEFHPESVTVSLAETTDSRLQLVVPVNPINLKAGELQRVPIFVRFPAELTKGTGKTVIKLEFRSLKEKQDKEMNLVGPY